MARTRLVDDVTEHLRQLILDGRLAPGTRLRQIELSEQLGVSRTPLREAFRVLEQDGLLQIANGNNTVEVIDFDDHEIVQLYQIREVLDGLAARLLAQRGLSADELAELRSYLEQMDRSRRPFDVTRYSPAHAAFHARLIELSGNSRLASYRDMIGMSFKLVTRRILARMAQSSEELQRLDEIFEVAQRQHTAILDAVAAGDPDEAERAARRHLRATIKGPLVDAPAN